MKLKTQVMLKNLKVLKVIRVPKIFLFSLFLAVSILLSISKIPQDFVISFAIIVFFVSLILTISKKADPSLKVRKRILLYILLLFFFLYGYIISINFFKLSLSDAFYVAPLKNTEISGIIIEDPYIDEGRTHFVISLESIKKDDVYKKVTGKSKVTVFGKYFFLLTNDKVKITGNLERTDDIYNKEYVFNLKTKGINTVISGFKVFNERKNSTFIDKLFEFRNFIKEKIKTSFKNNLSYFSYGIIKESILREKFLETEEKNLFRKTGTSHLFSVSGLHIVLIWGILYLFLRIFKINEGLKLFIMFLLLFFYLFLIGFPVSGLRAFLMTIFSMLAKFTGRMKTNLEALSWAFFVVLLINPLSLFDISFILSFIATATVIYSSFLLQNFNIKNDKIVSSQILTNRTLSFFKNTLRKFKENLLFNFLISIPISILAIFYFDSFSPLTPFANFFVVPAFSIFLFISILSLFLNICFHINFLNWILDLLSSFIFFVLKLLLKIPFSFLFIEITNKSFFKTFFFVFFLIFIIYLENKERIKAFKKANP